jgi:CspA family cold shock protein
MAKGTIRRLITDRGFGFIKTEDEKDLFFHRSNLEGVEYSSLREGQEVEYEVGQGSNGRSEAVKVRLAEAEVKEELPSAEETTEAPEAVEEGSTEAP